VVVGRGERREEGGRKGWPGENPYGGKRKDDDETRKQGKEPHKLKTSPPSLLQSISRRALDIHRSVNLLLLMDLLKPVAEKHGAQFIRVIHYEQPLSWKKIRLN